MDVTWTIDFRGLMEFPAGKILNRGWARMDADKSGCGGSWISDSTGSSWVKILDGGVLDDSPYLLCTERCVDGRYFQGGSVVSRWGIRGEVFFRGAKRGRPGRTVRIPGEVAGGQWLGWEEDWSGRTGLTPQRSSINGGVPWWRGLQSGFNAFNRLLESTVLSLYSLST